MAKLACDFAVQAHEDDWAYISSCFVTGLKRKPEYETYYTQFKEFYHDLCEQNAVWMKFDIRKLFTIVSCFLPYNHHQILFFTTANSDWNRKLMCHVFWPRMSIPFCVSKPQTLFVTTANSVCNRFTFVGYTGSNRKLGCNHEKWRLQSEFAVRKLGHNSA